LGRRVVSCRRV